MAAQTTRFSSSSSYADIYLHIHIDIISSCRAELYHGLLSHTDEMIFYASQNRHLNRLVTHTILSSFYLNMQDG